jgi:hypothetical protein
LSLERSGCQFLGVGNIDESKVPHQPPPVEFVQVPRLDISVPEAEFLHQACKRVRHEANGFDHALEIPGPDTPMG